MTDAKTEVEEWSPEAPVTEDMENICIEEVKRAGVHFDVCIPKTFRVEKSLIGASNYLVKLKVGVDKCLHVRICRALFLDKVTEESESAVIGVQYPKLVTDPLIPF